MHYFALKECALEIVHLMGFVCEDNASVTLVFQGKIVRGTVPFQKKKMSVLNHADSFSMPTQIM